MNKKLLLFGGIGAAVIIVAIVLILVLSGDDKAYRSIILIESEGNVTVLRDGSSLTAYANMKLRSGDGIDVPQGAFARLKLDGDKYVYLEENTKVSLQADGDEINSKTIIYIEEGRMLTEIENKLSSQASYDVVTPNTTMAIRGTVTSTYVRKGYADTDNAITEYTADDSGHGKRKKYAKKCLYLIRAQIRSRFKKTLVNP